MLLTVVGGGGPFCEYDVVRNPWNATSDTPTITGLPPYVTLLAWMEEVQNDILQLKEDIADSFHSKLTGELDAREKGGLGFLVGNEIMKKLKSLAGHISGMSNLADTPMTEPEFDTADSKYVLDEAAEIKIWIGEMNIHTPHRRARVVTEGY